MPNRIWYLAHPFGGDLGNVDCAERWVEWFTRTFDYFDVCAPWTSWTRRLDANFHVRGLAMDCEIISRFDGLLMVGPRISNGMTQERAAARAAGKLVLDLTGWAQEDIDKREFDFLYQIALRSLE